MTRREKTLTGCIGLTLAGLALYWVVSRVLVDPFVSLREQIATEQTRARDFKKSLAQLQNVDQEWQALTARTLSSDPKEAQFRFREVIHELLQQHGLVDDPNTKDTKISPGAFSRDRNGFIEVPLTITTAGTLKEVVGFLCDFYRQDWVARIDKVNLAANQSLVTPGSTARGGKAPPRGGPTPPRGGPTPPAVGPDGPELTISITTTALVLPKVGNIEPQPTADPNDLAQGMLAREVEAYKLVFDKNLFKRYVPPPPVVETKPSSQPVMAAATQPTPQPVALPVDPRPNADKQFFVGTTSLNGEPAAYVRDEQKPDKPVNHYRVGEPLDDGTLVLIEPHALVVRVKQADGQEKDFYYPLRQPKPASFKEREELKPEDHPELWKELQTLAGT
jgi:hypothetical protein